MDTNRTRFLPNQSSICSDSSRNDVALRMCLVGDLSNDLDLRAVAESFGLPIILSEDGAGFNADNCGGIVFVLKEFDGEFFEELHRLKVQILGPVALRQLALNGAKLPHNTRPLYNLAMSGVIVCFTGFREKGELAKLVSLIHHMGGSIRKEISSKVTHLIANCSGGEKYQYATTFRVPVMNPGWVTDSWQNRDDLQFSVNSDEFLLKHKLKPFHGARVSFVGFSEEEEKHMQEVLLLNGGQTAKSDDPFCTHIVMDSTETCKIDSKKSPHTQISPQNSSSASSISEKTPKSRKRKLFTSKTCPNNNEKRRKFSDFFKTPINRFDLSNRRLTIDSISISNRNETVKSTSGFFNISTLSVCETPKKKKKKLRFQRKFPFRKRENDDVDDDFAGNLNSTCFPDISFNNNHNNNNPNNNNSICEIGRKKRRRSVVENVAVVDESMITERPETSSKVWIVKAEWFWTSVQKESSLVEKDYLFDDYLDQIGSPSGRRESSVAAATGASSVSTPGSAARRRKRKLLLSSLVHPQSPAVTKRRSSVSDAGLLSVSGSFLDCTASPSAKELIDGTETVLEATPRKGLTQRQQVFLELLQTETNYVDILCIIMTMFKKHLEEMPEQEALLNNTELNLIFGKIPPIYETHVKMLDELRWTAAHWTEERTIGNIIVKYSSELQRAYPPFINYFEEMKEVLCRCDALKPRFHAFLKACQTRVECGRQSLQELMIRPVQRLGSISLLLNDILKNTAKTNPDYVALEQALAALREVMTHINEDKRKAEGQVTLFNIFNDIDNCPPDIVSSHRNFISKTDVVQLSSNEGLSSKGSALVLFLFSDQLEICKKKSKAAAFNSLKSPSSGQVSASRPSSLAKPFKHVRLLPLNAVKRVIDIKETEECQKVFSLVCRGNDDLKEKLFSFAVVDDEVDKSAFLRILTRQMANNACTADADKFMAYLEPQQLDIDTSDVNNGTLSKAFKFATTRLKVGRAFSFNKTPSKLKRAVSSMMSPFGSSTNITPASQLAQMKLASYTNINELGNNDESNIQPVAPMSVQPQRKLKSSSLGVNALKRL